MELKIKIEASPELLNALTSIASALKGDVPSKQVQTKSTPQTVSVGMLREAIKSKAKSGKLQCVQQLLQSFGIENVSSLPTEQYSKFLIEIEKL